MNNGLVIADSGPIISLVLADKLWILDELFDEIMIPKAVWNEITLDESKPFISKIKEYFAEKVQEIKGANELTFVMDYGNQNLLYYTVNPKLISY